MRTSASSDRATAMPPGPIPHAKILSDRLLCLFESQCLCDVAVVAKGVVVPYQAHRAVLAAMSPVLRERIRDAAVAARNGKKGAGGLLVVEEDKEDPEVVENVIKYIYTGVMDGDRVEASLKYAKALEIHGIDQTFSTGFGNDREDTNPNRRMSYSTIKSELSEEDDDLDLFEDSDEWDPMLAPELILHEDQNTQQHHPSISSLAMESSSAAASACEYPTLDLNISLPEDDAIVGGTEAAEASGDGQTSRVGGREESATSASRSVKTIRPKRGRPKGSTKKLTKSAAAPVAHVGNTKKYLCSLCGRTLAGLTAYNRHQVVHTGARPYECDICGKTFTQNQRLTVHARLHTGERPYLCSLCGKTFKESCKLKRHLASVHKANRDGDPLIPGQPVVNAKKIVEVTKGDEKRHQAAVKKATKVRHGKKSNIASKLHG